MVQDFKRISGNEFMASHKQKLEEKESYNPTHTESNQSFFFNTKIFIL